CLVLIGLAGCVATRPRALVPLWGAERFGSTFPYGTMIVNLSGCFIIAAVMYTALTLGWSPTLRLTITIGFLGGLTTYSSFNFETSRLIEEGALSAAAINATVTICGGFIAGPLGLGFAETLLRRRGDWRLALSRD